MLRHPWAPRVIAERPAMGQALLGYTESVLAILLDGGFSLELTHHAMHVLSSRVLGFNQDLFEDKNTSGPSPETAAIMAREMADRFPRITELAQAASHEGVLGPCDDDEEFSFGLEVILEGLERRRAAQTS
jgi:hypothetical protein